MATIEQHETTDVVVCGCGPTGAMLSAYLGQMNVPHIVLEKDGDITTDPRGIALDEDGIRLLQGVGLYGSIYTDIGTCMQKFKFIGGTDKFLDKNGFLEMDYATTEGGTGHVGFICHKQPALEKHLRESMTSFRCCELKSHASVFEITEDEQWTYCRYHDMHGNTRQIRSRFLVGADGKTGYTRKQYLEQFGIKMEQAHQASYEETWVALNWEIILPNETTHPYFPLWSLGYTPEQVYDLFFPTNFRFLCNPKRPAVCGRFGLPSDRLWRFEFVVLENEDGEEMAKPEMIKEIVFPYITHNGSRYKLPQDVSFPEDCIRVLRSRPFRFSARSCNKWSHGRVVLCGDSAHVFPPFGGQGIASGFRDAVSLAWRLALLCRPETNRSHEEVFSSWYLERKQQLENSLATTIENGRFVTESNPIKIVLRTCYLFILHLIPSWRRQLRLGRRKDGMVRYNHAPGFPFMPEYNGGLCLPQVYCKAMFPLPEGLGEVFFTDDVIFGGHKTGLFQMLIYIRDLNELALAREIISDVGDISRSEITAGDITFLVEDLADIDDDAGVTEQDMTSVFRLATAQEFAASALCHERPKPRFHDPYCLGKALDGNSFVIVRPDRFIFAACNTRHDLVIALLKMVAYLQG